MNFLAKKSKNSTIMVYPANGYKGYMICKELAHGQTMEIKEVIAVCCCKEGMYDKLKDMGKPIKTIVLDDASHIADWKKAMKDRKCGAMMLCADGAPHHNNTAREEDGKGQLKKFAESMENALEMTRHMNCKTVAVSTAFAADESKYQKWNHIYRTMEKACKKYFKGNYATLFHNMMLECLYLNREEMMQKSTLSWPVAADAKASPISTMDFAQCCICVMKKMMKYENQTVNMEKKFHLTGCETMTPSDMMDIMSTSFNMEVRYNQVNRNEWKGMMEKERVLSPLEICLEEEVFEMMKKGDLKKCTDDCKKITGHNPMKCEKWLDEHRDKFQSF